VGLIEEKKSKNRRRSAKSPSCSRLLIAESGTAYVLKEYALPANHLTTLVAAINPRARSLPLLADEHLVLFQAKIGCVAQVYCRIQSIGVKTYHVSQSSKTNLI